MYSDGIDVRLVSSQLSRLPTWLRCESFHINLAFKRVIGKDYEVVFATKEDTLEQGE